MNGRAYAAIKAVWWGPMVAICALLLGRVGLVSRAYCIVVGHDWSVLSNCSFCRLRLAPQRR